MNSDVISEALLNAWADAEYELEKAGDLLWSEAVQHMTPGLSQYDALFVAPKMAWAWARANEWNYKRRQWKFVPLNSWWHELHGLTPDEEGNPIIYLCVGDKLTELQTQYLADLVEYAKAKGFEIIDLWELGMNG